MSDNIAVFLIGLFLTALVLGGMLLGHQLPPSEKQIIQAIHSYQSNAFVNAERLKRIEKALKEEK